MHQLTSVPKNRRYDALFPPSPKLHRTNVGEVSEEGKTGCCDLRRLTDIEHKTRTTVSHRVPLFGPYTTVVSDSVINNRTRKMIDIIF